MKKKHTFRRRSTLKGMGAFGAASLIGVPAVFGQAGRYANPVGAHASGDIRWG